MIGLELQCENETPAGKLIYHIFFFLVLHNYLRPPSWPGKLSPLSVGLYYLCFMSGCCWSQESV